MITEANAPPKCQLCKKADATKKNSHFAPAGLLATMVGKRDYEEVYTIATSEKDIVSSFFGRANLKNTDPTIKQNPLAADFIFCPACEERFAKIESKVIPALRKEQQLVYGIGGKMPQLFSCNGINVAEGRLFFLGVVWRINLQLRIQGVKIPDEESELLRQYLDLFMSENVASDTAHEVQKWPVKVYTPDKEADQNISVTTIIPDDSIPRRVIINDFVVMFSRASDAPDWDELNLKSDKLVLTVQDYATWERMLDLLYKAIANTQWNNYVKELQDLHGCTFEDAAAKLKAEFEIVEKTEGGKEYAKYSQLAFERLCLPPKSI